MAILGAQLVISLIMVSVMQKIGSHYSLARWLLCSTGLVRYLYPTDNELRTVAGIPKDKVKGKKSGKNNDKSDVFRIPRNLDIQLESAKVTAGDIVHLRFYFEYQWLVDFSFYAAIVFFVSEVVGNLYTTREEINLSVLWCALVLGFAFKVLCTLTMQYFKGEKSTGERSTVIVTAFVYLLIAMMVMVVDERTLEIGLDKAYVSFNSSAAKFLGSHGLQSSGPASKLVLKFFLAQWCAILGGLFTFPGIRMAKMHFDSLKYYEGCRVRRTLLNISFAAPLVLVLMWVKPVSRDYLTVRVFGGMNGPLMSSDSFDSLRVILIIVVVLSRLVLMPLYLQAYLNMADQRLQQQKREAGRITNHELQEKIAGVFYYLCVVALQYVIPLVTCLFFAFMYKSLGNVTWTGVPPNTNATISRTSFSPISGESTSIFSEVKQFTFAVDSLKNVFTTDVSRGVLGFATWWSCFSLFSASSLGFLYQTYFANV